MKGQKSLIKNYMYNISLTLLNIIFPIITFPYISRVIGAGGVGKVGFATSIVNYFCIFACLGIPIYGVREIAKYRDDANKVSKVFTELIVINAIATFLFASIYFFIVLKFNFFSNEKELYIVSGILLILNFFNIDWMYQGFENYKFITIRSVIVKIISMALLFTLVHNKGDYVKYALVNIVALSGMNILNVIQAHKHVKLNFKNLNLHRHMKFIVLLFSSQLAINVYINLDTTMIGILAGDKYVGYYTAALKINRMVLGVVTSLGVVLMPRLSYYIKNEMKTEFDTIISKSIKGILFLSVPCCVGLYALAPQIINLFSGKEFLAAVPTMRITVLTILFIGLNNLTGMQILTPLGKEKQLLVSVIIGAIVNFIMNLILIPLYQQNGAAIASVFAEFVVLVVQLMYIQSYMKNKLINKNNFSYIFGGFLIFIVVYAIQSLKLNDIRTVIYSVISGFIIYVGFNLIKKDEICMELFRKVKDVKNN